VSPRQAAVQVQDRGAAEPEGEGATALTTKNQPPSTTAIGCRVKSGWAVTVLLAGPVGSPHVLDRRRIELSDPSVPDTMQPYHAGLHAERIDPGAVEQLTRLVARCAHQELAGLVRAYRAMGYQPTRIGIVVGSIIDPATIANPHIRAHAQEGRLFRTVVETAAKGLSTGPGTHRRASLAGRREGCGRGGVACPRRPCP